MKVFTMKIKVLINEPEITEHRHAQVKVSFVSWGK